MAPQRCCRVKDRPDRHGRRDQLSRVNQVSGGGSVQATGGSLESLVKQAHQRLRELERRADGVERMTTDKVNTLRIESQRESEKANRATEERFADLEMQTIRIRTNDALRLLLGIGLSLIGATLSTLC